MKDFVISVNNIVLYISLAVIWLLAFIVLFSGEFLSALGIFVGGSLGWCVISGFWFVQSATYEELRKLNAKKA
jgi:positive regulator of sigma E activity